MADDGRLEGDGRTDFRYFEDRRPVPMPPGTPPTAGDLAVGAALGFGAKAPDGRTVRVIRREAGPGAQEWAVFERHPDPDAPSGTGVRFVDDLPPVRGGERAAQAYVLARAREWGHADAPETWDELTGPRGGGQAG